MQTLQQWQCAQQFGWPSTGHGLCFVIALLRRLWGATGSVAASVTTQWLRIERGLCRVDGLHTSSEARLVPGRLVLVDDAFYRHPVDHRDRLGQRVFGIGLITTFDGRFDPFQEGSKHRTMRCVTGATGNILSGALACLRAICHAKFLALVWGKKSGVICR